MLGRSCRGSLPTIFDSSFIYAGEAMARPTKHTTVLAGRIGRPPHTVQGWLDRGYGPAAPLSAIREREHFDAVALHLGPGHDPEVAFLKLAGADHPTAGLRASLQRLALLDPGEEDTKDADELIEYGTSAPRLDPFMRKLRPAADSVSKWDTHPEPASRDAILSAALLPLAQVLTGEKVEAPDTLDMSRTMDAAFCDGSGQPDEYELDRARFNLALLQGVAFIAKESQHWLDSADPVDLARGVQAADMFLDTMEIMGVHISERGEEERWRSVGRLAPMALPMSRMLSAVYEVLRLIPIDEMPLTQRAVVNTLDRLRLLIEDVKT
jgi:hypothetical protein